MQNTGSSHRPTRASRMIGPIGTTARTIVGTLLVGSVVQGHLAGPFRPVANVVSLAVLMALYLTPEYAPALAITSDAALLFYGASMLLAALRGYAGCEVLAVPNWLLGRDDQVGCLLFWLIDHPERRRTRAGMSASQ